MTKRKPGAKRGGARKGAGRPREQKLQRCYTVTLSLTQDEYLEARQAAEELEMSVCSMVRHWLMLSLAMRKPM